MNRLVRSTALTLLGMAALSAGCVQTKTGSVVAPTPATSTTTPGAGPSYLGTWASASSATAPSPGSCTNLQWTISSQTSTAIAGTFSATCGGGVTISGSASGELQGTTVPITVSGTATLSGVSCPFTISGTGTIVDDNTLTLPYTGTSCLGPFGGTETLHRQ